MIKWPKLIIIIVNSNEKCSTFDFFVDGVKAEEKKGTTLIEKETVETGSVKMAVYFYYMRVCHFKKIQAFGFLKV